MPTPKFILKEPNSKDETLIYVVLRFNYKRLKVSTGDKIKFKYWNPKTQKAKELRGKPELKELNTRLGKISSTMLAAYRKLQNNDIIPTPENLREKYDELMGFEAKKKGVHLFDFIDNLISQRKVTFKPNTIKKYKTTKKHLKNYCKHKGLNTLDFDDISLDFYYDFMEYMKVELSFAENTCGKYIATLKTFLSDATEAGYNKRTDFKSARFIKPFEEVDKIYLNERELTKIYNLDLSDNVTLEKVRDLFIVECCLGQRFSDMEKLNINDITEHKGEQIITIRTSKTNAKVAIPLHDRVKEIIAKYDNSFPKVLSNQKTNEYLKDIGKLAKINDLVSTSKNKKGMKVYKDKPKHELITTHTARRSFATNLFLGEVTVLSIMKMTGHKTEKSFMGYIRMSPMENAIKLINNDFFKEKEVKVVKLNA